MAAAPRPAGREPNCANRSPGMVDASSFAGEMVDRERNSHHMPACLARMTMEENADLLLRNEGKTVGLNTDLTEAQKQALKENSDDLEKLQLQLDEVRRTARSRLESAGLATPIDVINCLVCVACEGWSTGTDGKCANCPHPFFSHNVK
ncbi:hypothetical protein ACWGE1_39460 [Streptomyces sp. NPDC054932]